MKRYSLKFMNKLYKCRKNSGIFWQNVWIIIYNLQYIPM